VSAFSPRDVEDLLELGRRQLEELTELRRQAAQQTRLLERILEKLASLDRLQGRARSR
jgi:hypothetical protein